jgi:hypothetical protein
MLTVKRHVQPSGATNDAVFLHGNSHPLARILPYIYQDYVPDMETDIRRTGFCKEKTKKHFVGIQEIPSPHITVYQRNTMTKQKTIAA